MPSDPVKPYQQNGGPLLYFGGISPRSKDVSANHCAVFLMWPERADNIHANKDDMSERAAQYGRKKDVGLRVHAIGRENEEDARPSTRTDEHTPALQPLLSSPTDI